MSAASDITPIVPGRGTPNLNVALIAAKREMGPALKLATNPHFKSRFVDLAGVAEAADAALGRNGLAVTQTTKVRENGMVVLVTKLRHTSGEEEEGEYPIVPAKDRDPQALGAAMTYARRYAKMAILDLAPEDDDGTQGSAKPQPRPQQTPAHPLLKEAAPATAPKAPSPAASTAVGSSAAATTAPTATTSQSASPTTTTRPASRDGASKPRGMTIEMPNGEVLSAADLGAVATARQTAGEQREAVMGGPESVAAAEGDVGNRSTQAQWTRYKQRLGWLGWSSHDSDAFLDARSGTTNWEVLTHADMESAIEELDAEVERAMPIHPHSIQQRKQFFALAKHKWPVAGGAKYDEAAMRDWLYKEHGLSSIKLVDVAGMSKLIEAIIASGPNV